MELEFIWDDLKWFPALSLPTLEWATPFLPLMGLPDLLLKQPEVLKVIHAQAITEFKKRRKELGWALAKEGAFEQLTKEIVTLTLKNLATQMARSVAVDLEAWIIFHFIYNEAQTAISEWGIVLSYAYLTRDSRRGQRKIDPPLALIPLLPEIYDFVNFERRQLIKNNLMDAAPAPAYEQIPYEYMEKCFEATMLSSALGQALTLKALQTIASKLDSTQRHEVVKWAQAQIIAMDSRHGYTRSQELCGDKYFLLQLTDLNLPSVFNTES